MGLPMGQKIVKSGSTWARVCGTHISGIAGWIYTIWSFVELSKPVAVQPHGHLTLTLNFQDQILKMLYLRNRRANWHGTKGMRVNRMLDPLCEFELWHHTWTWPWIFKVNFLFISSCISGTAGPINLEMKGIWVDMMLYLLCDRFGKDGVISFIKFSSVEWLLSIGRQSFCYEQTDWTQSWYDCQPYNLSQIDICAQKFIMNKMTLFFSYGAFRD